MPRVLRISASYESRSAISNALGKLVNEVQSQGPDTVLTIAVDEDAGTGVEQIEVEFVDEGNDEFAEPSAAMKIENRD